MKFRDKLSKLPDSGDSSTATTQALTDSLQTLDNLTYSLESAKTSRFQNNTKLRGHMSYWASSNVTCWLIFVAATLIYNDKYLCLSNSVLITLITTTTVNVIGIILICFKDLFNGKSEDSIK